MARVVTVEQALDYLDAMSDDSIVDEVAPLLEDTVVTQSENIFTETIIDTQNDSSQISNQSDAIDSDDELLCSFIPVVRKVGLPPSSYTEPPTKKRVLESDSDDEYLPSESSSSDEANDNPMDGKTSFFSFLCFILFLADCFLS